MNCQCPGCNKSFPVDPDKVPPEGVFARCSNCSEVFFVQLPDEGLDAIPLATDAAQPAMEEPSLGVEVEEDRTPSEKEWEAPEDVEVVTEEVEAVVEEGLQDEADQVPEDPEGIVSGVAAPEAAEPEEVEEVEPDEGPEPQFGKRDPKDKARRLARVLVSDIILYNPDRHEQALQTGHVKEEFEDEIQKSWDEYVEQVGDDIASGTPFFTEALNEILAEGEEIF